MAKKDRILRTRDVCKKYGFPSENAVRLWASRNNVPRKWGKYWESDVVKYLMR